MISYANNFPEFSVAIGIIGLICQRLLTRMGSIEWQRMNGTFNSMKCRYSTSGRSIQKASDSVSYIRLSFEHMELAVGSE